MCVWNFFLKLTFIPKSNAFVLRPSDDDSIWQAQNWDCVLVALQHCFALPCVSIPDSRGSIPRATNEFFRHRLTETVNWIFVSFEYSQGVSLTVYMHNFSILGSRIEAVVLNTKTIYCQQKNFWTYFGATASTKLSWYVNSLSNAYWPVALSRLKSLLEESIEPDTKASISGRTVKHLTAPWCTAKLYWNSKSLSLTLKGSWCKFG